MSRILVLGGTGLIGRNCVEYFAGKGHDVYATSFTRRPAITAPNITWDYCDLTDKDEIACIMDDFDVVIQCAAATSGAKDIVTNPALHVTDNAIMNALIFPAAVKAGVKHVIFFSCTTMWSNGVCTEETPIDIHPKYFGVAHTKLYNEKMAEFYAGIGETKFTVIRHSNCYGPHDK